MENVYERLRSLIIYDGGRGVSLMKSSVSETLIFPEFELRVEKDGSFWKKTGIWGPGDRITRDEFVAIIKATDSKLYKELQNVDTSIMYLGYLEVGDRFITIGTLAKLENGYKLESVTEPRIGIVVSKDGVLASSNPFSCKGVDITGKTISGNRIVRITSSRQEIVGNDIETFIQLYEAEEPFSRGNRYIEVGPLTLCKVYGVIKGGNLDDLLSYFIEETRGCLLTDERVMRLGELKEFWEKRNGYPYKEINVKKIKVTDQSIEVFYSDSSIFKIGNEEPIVKGEYKFRQKDLDNLRIIDEHDYRIVRINGWGAGHLISPGAISISRAYWQTGEEMIRIMAHKDIKIVDERLKKDHPPRKSVRPLEKIQKR